MTITATHASCGGASLFYKARPREHREEDRKTGRPSPLHVLRMSWVCATDKRWPFKMDVLACCGPRKHISRDYHRGSAKKTSGPSDSLEGALVLRVYWQSGGEHCQECSGDERSAPSTEAKCNIFSMEMLFCFLHEWKLESITLCNWWERSSLPNLVGLDILRWHGGPDHVMLSFCCFYTGDVRALLIGFGVDLVFPTKKITSHQDPASTLKTQSGDSATSALSRSMAVCFIWECYSFS